MEDAEVEMPVSSRVSQTALGEDVPFGFSAMCFTSLPIASRTAHAILEGHQRIIHKHTYYQPNLTPTDNNVFTPTWSARPDQTSLAEMESAAPAVAATIPGRRRPGGKHFLGIQRLHERAPAEENRQIREAGALC